jgi:drug/metabolite transporter (DMT)-like permease
MTVQLGIFLALLCALATNLGFLYKHRGACAAADVDWKHPLRSGASLFRSKWFALGMLVAVGAWALHVGAMAMAPLSVVQPVIAGGLVFLTVLAERFFGFSVGRRQWTGVGLTSLGLVLLAVTLPGASSSHSNYSTAAMIAFEAGLLAVGTLLVMSHKFGARHEHHGVLLGVASGILFGVSDVAIKALTGLIGSGGVGGLLSPWLATCVIASVIAFFASARGLQKGEAVPVITLTAAAANVSAIAGGIIVFGDPMPHDAVGICLQAFAFVLVVVAALVTPPPMQAASAHAQPV